MSASAEPQSAPSNASNAGARVVAAWAQRVLALGPWLGQAGLPFLLISYLGLKSGGYDIVVRSEVGIALWWIVLLGAAVGALPLSRLGRAEWTALGVLVALAAWTGLGIAWSESAERSAAELGRVAALAGIFALALSVQGPPALRRVVGGVAAAITLVGTIALLSRLHPSWFPDLDAPRLLAGTEARLHYPLDYWNGLAALVALGVPLLLALATTARKTLWRATAVAAVPLLALTSFLTLSRGGAGAVVIALIVLFALHPRRGALLASGAVAGVGSAILIAAANQRSELTDGVANAAGLSQGDEILAMALVVSAGTGLLAAALALADRHMIGPRFSISRNQRRLAAGLAAIVVAVAAVGLSGKVSSAWDDFKQVDVAIAGAERFQSASGNGRYQFWQAAVDAGKSEPLLGVGPGTYEYFWSREGTLPVFVRDAHSLYLEAFAELGVIGLALILALIGSAFVLGARGLRALDNDRRSLVAGALAACAAFAFAAAIDWAWELTVLPAIFLILMAAAIWRPAPGSAPPPSARSPLAPRLILPGLALAALVAIAIPMAATSTVRASEDEVERANLAAALGEARAAADIQSYAALPELQSALVLELRGELDAAVRSAREATRAEPTNWRTWLVRSRLEARTGNAGASIGAYREARSLNPRSILFR